LIQRRRRWRADSVPANLKIHDGMQGHGNYSELNIARLERDVHREVSDDVPIQLDRFTWTVDSGGTPGSLVALSIATPAPTALKYPSAKVKIGCL